MKHNYFLLDADLSLFDGGAAGAGAAGAGADAGGDGSQAGSQAIPGSSRRGKSGGQTPKVIYGKQAEQDTGAASAGEGTVAGGQKPEGEGGTTTTTPTKEERQAEFRKLVDGDYKDLFTEETQRIIDRRFRETRSLQEQLGAHQPLIEMLCQKYGIQDGDVAKLVQAVEADDAQWAEAAERAGMSVEQYRNYQRMQRENEAFRRMQQQAKGQQAAQQQYTKWLGEAEQVKSQYPDFDLEAEIGNTQFQALLKSGVPMQHAYEVLHLDSIKGGVAQQTAQQTEKAVTENIRAKGNRPTENGVAAQTGVLFKSDVSKLTKQDRAEIARRAQRGENIAF